MSIQPGRACWCGGRLDKEIGGHYRCCSECGAAVLGVMPERGHFEVSDDEHDFYGKHYWTDYSTARSLPDISERALSDLSERCLFWLERLLEVVHPPGRALEIGCGHGGFVGLMRELGFDAQGTEMSGWVVEFAKRAFRVPVLQGPFEALDLDPGFVCISAFDVLEHVNDPLEIVRRCGDLLTPEGVLLLQTPWYRGEGPDWSMFQPDEHIHLFTEESIRLLLGRAGFREVVVRPSLFPYDMWVVATRGQLHMRAADEVNAARDWRMPVAFRSLLDVSRQLRRVREGLATAEADSAARLAQVEELTGQVRELDMARREDAARLSARVRAAEAENAARLAQVEELTRQVRGVDAARREDAAKLTALVHAAEADSAARLGQVEELTGLLHVAEAESTARLGQVEELTGLLHVAEAESTARLGQVEELTALLHVVEADSAARLGQVEELTGLLHVVEADSTARLGQVEELTALLHVVEADSAARLGQVEELTRLVHAVETDSAARLAQVEELTGLLRAVQADGAARLAQVESLTALLRESDAARAAGLDEIHEMSRNLQQADADLAAVREQVAEMERTWAWRLYRALPSSLKGRRPAE